MSQLIHALGMKLRESVSSKVVYKVILVAHLETIVTRFYTDSRMEAPTAITFIAHARINEKNGTVEKFPGVSPGRLGTAGID